VSLSAVVTGAPTCPNKRCVDVSPFEPCTIAEYYGHTSITFSELSECGGRTKCSRTRDKRLASKTALEAMRPGLRRQRGVRNARIVMVGKIWWPLGDRTTIGARPFENNTLRNWEKVWISCLEAVHRKNVDFTSHQRPNLTCIVLA